MRIKDIDSGNSNLTSEGIQEILTTVHNVSNMNYKISKYEICQKLHLSRSTFDNYVRSNKIPKGQKQVGFKELFWTLRDAEDFKTNYWKR